MSRWRFIPLLLWVIRDTLGSDGTDRRSPTVTLDLTVRDTPEPMSYHNFEGDEVKGTLILDLL